MANIFKYLSYMASDITMEDIVYFLNMILLAVLEEFFWLT
jgi:hypothetical protein